MNNLVIYAGNEDQDTPWKIIPKTDDARQSAIRDGYNAFTSESFEFEPIEGKTKPLRYGSFWIRILGSNRTCEDNLLLCRELIKYIALHYVASVEYFNYFMNGNGNIEIEIPASHFDGCGGDVDLNEIHKEMLQRLIKGRKLNVQASLFDESLYCGGKGILIKDICETSGESCGRIQFSYDDFMKIDGADVLNLFTIQGMKTKLPNARIVSHCKPEKIRSSGLVHLYKMAKSIVEIRRMSSSCNSLIQALLDCDFIEHCYQNQRDLCPRTWEAMVRCLMALGEEARPIVHSYSYQYPQYDEQSINKRIDQILKEKQTVTCQEIKKMYPCTRNCTASSPIAFMNNTIKNRINAINDFSLREDGVYYTPANSSPEGTFLCSHMEVLGHARDSDGTCWSRLVSFSTRDGKRKVLCVLVKDCSGRGETAKSLLLDNGLEINHNNKLTPFLLEYILNGGSNDIYLILEKFGWADNTYLLPDASFGEQFSEKIHINKTMDSYNKASGTLEDWKENVGKYCKGNPLLMFLTAYALTGVLLRPTNLEGGGLHVYGPSSTGKTTCALIAGSVCGGGGNNGYIRQWRSTHNALENTAAMHNDNLLVLDEIGQATADTVSQTAYMLANGQGRDRMRSDASRRQPPSWRLNFLSTGELTTNDKIEETGRQKSMAGQVVRIIDLPIDESKGKNIFANLHGLPDASTLSSLLARNSTKYYGTPLRAFLEQYCKNNVENQQEILNIMDIFVKENVPAQASGQVVRVAKKFGLIAAAGELAIRWKILPYKTKEFQQAVRHWFSIWIIQRGGVGDIELNNVLERIQAHFETERSRYVDLDNNDTRNDSINRQAGFFWTHCGVEYYLMLPIVFKNLIKGASRKTVLNKLKELRWTDRDVSETKYAHGKTFRGYVFYPHQMWPKEEDSKKSHKHNDELVKAEPPIYSTCSDSVQSSSINNDVYDLI